MAEFASKGVAGSALGLGIAGLSVALLNGGLGGGLGGILGGGNTNAYVDSLNSKIADLNAEKYSDKIGIEVFKAARASANEALAKAGGKVTAYGISFDRSDIDALFEIANKYGG